MHPLPTSPPSACALLFMRAPLHGRVKTRLARSVGDAAVLALYRAFVQDVLAAVVAAGCTPLLCVTPSGQLSAVSRWLGRQHRCWPQPDGPLGERMAAAFQHVFAAGVDRAILLGSDIPDLPPRVIASAMRALERRAAVIGPSSDGGYYLIGFQASAYRAAVFEGIAWGTPEVFTATCQRFAQAGVTPRRLPTWWDVDDDDDLAALIRRLAQATTRAERTGQALRRLGRL
jgi:hypothetical protein